MAWFSYNCTEHGKFKVSIEKRMATHKCPHCGIECGAIMKTGSTQIVERLDNGLMARRVERPYNAEEMTREIAEKDDQRLEEKYGKLDD